MPEQPHVYIVDGGYYIRRAALESADTTHVTVRTSYGRQTFRCEFVFDDWEAAVARYWELCEQELANLKRAVKNLERRLAKRKGPPLLQRDS